MPFAFRRGFAVRLLCLTAVVLTASALLVSPAGAAIVTVGSPLTAAFKAEAINNEKGTLVNQTLTEAGARTVSPVNGVIVRWRLIDTKGPHSLRVVRPVGGGTFAGAGRSASVSPAGLGIETFAANLKIQAGDTIGLDNDEPEFTYYGRAESPGGQLLAWLPPLAEGTSASPFAAAANIEVGFNADIQPAPAIIGLSPGSGALGGGTAVVISGSDLEGASAVSFGGAPASSYTVDSESQITAVPPPRSTPGAVDVSITTIAGTSPVVAADAFTYTAPLPAPLPPLPGCVVPKLKDHKLKTDRKKLQRADCKLGRVKKRNGATAKTGKVKAQRPRPGKVLAPGSKVDVTLG